MTSVKITRRIALDIPYEYYELEATYDPEEVEGKDIIKGFEKQVKTIRKVTATKEPKQEGEKKPAKKKRAAPQSSEDIKIVDLKAGDKVNMSVRFLKLGDVKAFVRDSKAATYCKCYVEDDSGQIQMTLFDEQIELVKDAKENAWLEIKNGYVKEWQGRLELSVGKWGTLEVVYNG